MADVQQLLRSREAQFIETRTKIELEVSKFLESLKDIEDDIKDIPGRPTGTTAREILPALWIEPFNKAAYEEQLEAFNVYVDAVVGYANKINNEAEICLRS